MPLGGLPDSRLLVALSAGRLPPAPWPTNDAAPTAASSAAPRGGVLPTASAASAPALVTLLTLAPLGALPRLTLTLHASLLGALPPTGVGLLWPLAPGSTALASLMWMAWLC